MRQKKIFGGGNGLPGPGRRSLCAARETPPHASRAGFAVHATPAPSPGLRQGGQAKRVPVEQFPWGNWEAVRGGGHWEALRGPCLRGGARKLPQGLGRASPVMLCRIPLRRRGSGHRYSKETLPGRRGRGGSVERARPGIAPDKTRGGGQLSAG